MTSDAKAEMTFKHDIKPQLQSDLDEFEKEYHCQGEITVELTPELELLVQIKPATPV